ncbi:MAG: Sporulation protein YabP [Desulfotomaculum sp. 46_296]|nr:MAG: Sporulation protein YabP [Desulfotomaculum sp. 46_296]KUK84730.1 MAG: Sporulation protein YabP [Desulfofundulus kuznetsovii]HAU32576.1 sporulation protein YabP [Desulfotomaculum sp.]
MEEQAGNKVTLTDRKNLALAGVKHVEKFNDDEIMLDTNMGILSLKGEGLSITQLDLEKGTLTAQGFFAVIQFKENSKTIQRLRGKNKVFGRFSK